MLQSFFHGLSVCCPFFLSDALLTGASFWRRLTLSVLFRLTASSHPGFPFSPFSCNALSSGAFAEPSPACVLVPLFGIFSSKLLTSRKAARWCCKLFPLTDFLLQIKDLPTWWIRCTDGLYRGPTQEKNYLLLVGIKPGSPSCESDILPLDHGLPHNCSLLFGFEAFSLAGSSVIANEFSLNLPALIIENKNEWLLKWILESTYVLGQWYSGLSINQSI